MRTEQPNDSADAARPGPLGRIARVWLTSRRVPVGVALIATLLTLPSLGVGWVFDDHIHRAMMTAPPSLVELRFAKSDVLMGLFSFMDGDPERNRRMIDFGLLPWWTYEQVRAMFWRPITAATHLLDYRFWPEQPEFMHAQSILWFAALVAAAAVLYRRLMGLTWTAGLAALLYAIDDAHGTPVGFLANRNALVAGVFGVLTIIAHDRWRRQGWRVGAALGPALLLVSLLSAEAGVGAVGYLVAHALFLDRGSRRQRLRALLPYACIVLIWRVVWTRLGYGVSAGMSFYIDPAVEPLSFALTALYRAPVLLAGQWGMLSDLSLILTPFGRGAVGLHWLVSVVLVTVVAGGMVPLLGRDRLARYWACGMILSLVPVCAVMPSDRLLTFVGLGAMGVLARFLSIAFERSADGEAGGWDCLSQADILPTAPRRRAAHGSLVVALVLVHLIIAPVALSIRAANPTGPAEFMEQFHVRTPMDESVNGQDVVIVNAPIVVFAGHMSIRRALEGQPFPRHTRVLSASGVGVELTRRDSRTLVLRPDGGYLAWPMDRFFRGNHDPFTPGWRIELTGVTVEVTALTADGRPAEAAFHFAVPLEHPSLRWLRWDDPERRFIPYTPPPIGETVRL